MVLIHLTSRAFQFDLEFHGKICFLLGSSGSRKTHFVSLCAKLRNKYKSVHGSIKVDGRTLGKEEINIFSNESAEIDYENLLKHRQNSLFIVDEFSDIHKCREFSSWILNSNNYFIFIARKVYGFFPVHVQSVYEFKRLGSRIVNIPKYKKFDTVNLGGTEYILTEDSGSGRQFFIRNFKQIETCAGRGIVAGKVLSRDNSQLHNFLEEEIKTRDHILVVYDAAAYASFYDSLLDVLDKAKKQHKQVKVLDWESFEHYVLSIPMFGEAYHMDDAGCQYNSLEQMCEKRLADLIHYRKDALLPCLDRYQQCHQCRSYNRCNYAGRRKQKEIIAGRLKTLDRQGI